MTNLTDKDFVNFSSLYKLYLILQKLTHSMPSIKGVSGQSFSGKRCTILPHVNNWLSVVVPNYNKINILYNKDYKIIKQKTFTYDLFHYHSLQ